VAVEIGVDLYQVLRETPLPLKRGNDETRDVLLWHDFAHVLGGTFGGRRPKQFVTFLTHSGHRQFRNTAMHRADPISQLANPCCNHVLREQRSAQS